MDKITDFVEEIYMDNQPAATPEVLSLEARSAWQSIPRFVRLAVWLWSLAVVLGVVFGMAAALALIGRFG